MHDLTLEERATNFETYRHILEVQRLLLRASHMLQERCLTHDQSKLVPPEVDTFTRMTPKLKHCTYGSEEYKGFLAEMAPALKHHYEHNSHHPEHFPNGIEGMTLIDALEMLLDWIASSKRHADGNAYRSIAINEERFKISPQLVALLTNTVKVLCPEIEPPKEQ